MAKPTRLTEEMIENYKMRGIWDEISIADILTKKCRAFSRQSGRQRFRKSAHLGGIE